MVKVEQLVAGVAVATSLVMVASPVQAQYSGGHTNPPPAAPAPTHQHAEGRGDYRPGAYSRDGGRRPEGGDYRSGRDVRIGYGGGREGPYGGYGGHGGYGRDGFGWRNGGYANRGYPASGYGGYRNGPMGFAPLPGYGPVGYMGWGYGAAYLPAVVVPQPAYRGWGLAYGFGYVAAPVVVAAPVYRGWGRGF